MVLKKHAVLIFLWVCLATSHSFAEEGVTVYRCKQEQVRQYQPYSGSGAPRNIIIFQGDGMGLKHQRAASIYKYGEDKQLNFQKFPYQTMVSTYCRDGEVTDSAASSTAMASGLKVPPATVSMEPDGSVCYPTVLEVFQAAGMRCGLVTTSRIYDSSPAAFGSHAPTKKYPKFIIQGVLAHTKPFLLLGSGSELLQEEAIRAAGYHFIDSMEGLKLSALDQISPEKPVWGVFAPKLLPIGKADQDVTVDMDGGFPSLAAMTKAALRRMENSPRGFFLFIEDERVDEAAHVHNLSGTVHGVLALEHAVALTLDWLKLHDRQDTLILVVADHETGGLDLPESYGKGQLPKATWQTDYHTKDKVAYYAWGKGAERLTEVVDNTGIFSLLVEPRPVNPGHP